MNKIILFGRLTRDPELRYTSNGMAVCQITIAVNRPKIKDKEQETDFINVIVWDKLAENVAKYQTKGNQIAIEGKLQTSNYKDKENKTIYKLEVIATSIHYIEKAKKEEKIYKVNDIKAEELDEFDTPF